MAIIESWLPPSREHWELITWAFQFFPLLTVSQWISPWYGMGKTSTDSRFNIPGKVAWATMEAPGFITLLYIMWTLPHELGIEKLPGANWLMAILFTVHYIYRAIVAPLFLNPSMSPIHAIVWLAAVSFQVVNATSIGGWLAGHGPTTTQDWEGSYLYIEVGFMIFALGLMGNMFHDDELREIRRAAARNLKRRQEATGEKDDGKGVDKVYMIPQNGLFNFVLYAHYFCEWIEWGGYWMIGGLACVPARNFLVAEIATMTARAVQGRRWYIERFGKEKIGSKKAVIPGLL